LEPLAGLPPRVLPPISPQKPPAIEDPPNAALVHVQSLPERSGGDKHMGCNGLSASCRSQPFDRLLSLLFKLRFGQRTECSRPYVPGPTLPRTHTMKACRGPRVLGAGAGCGPKKKKQKKKRRRPVERRRRPLSYWETSSVERSNRQTGLIRWCRTSPAPWCLFFPGRSTPAAPATGRPLWRTDVVERPGRLRYDLHTAKV